MRKTLNSIARILAILLVSLSGVVLLAKPAFAIANPDNIAFGTGADSYYKVFYNVLETGDWLAVAEGYVYYNLAAYETLSPTGAGIETNLTPSAGANWQCVSDSNDATYVWTASTSYVRDLYALADATATTGTINSVTLYFRIINSGADTTYGVPTFYINGNYYNGSYQTATAGWATKYESFTTNPSTSSAWTWNDINDMQIGVNLLTSNIASQARCSEVYAVVNYTMINPEYTASQAFLFELLDVAGTTTLASTPLKSYGDRPIGIYLTATQVSTLGLTTGTAYKVRITGNPAIFGALAGNTVTVTFGVDDYVDQLLGVDDGIPTNNPLRNGMMKVANNMENHDAPLPADSYIATVQGYEYLSSDGGDLFITGISGLSSMCPILFQTGVNPVEGDEPENTGAYALTLTPAQKWGNTVANGLTTLGSYLGINQALAGSVMLFFLVIAFAVFVYQRTESGVTVLLMVSATPFLGAYLGLMPMALAFIFVIIIITLLGYFFFSRGAL